MLYYAVLCMILFAQNLVMVHVLGSVHNICKEAKMFMCLVVAVFASISRY